MEWQDPNAAVGFASAVLIQPWDGKIVVAGAGSSGYGYFSLARLNTDGSVDTSFGHKGSEVSKFSADGLGFNFAALYSSSDTTGNAKKIVEAGVFSMVRFNANGSVDTTFGSRGQVAVALAGGIRGVVIQPADGKIVVLGAGGELSRYNPNGTLDTTFGAGGTATVSLSSTGAVATALALQSDGKLVVAGYDNSSSNGWELARLNPNGTLDTTFGSTGHSGTVFTTLANAEVFGLAIYPNTGTDIADDGKIVAVGSAQSNPALARYNPDGTPDTIFGQSGQVDTPVPNGGFLAFAVAMQADGKIIAAGRFYPVGSAPYEFGLLRYNTNGSLDTTFGNGGIVLTPTGASSQARAVAIQADGRIIVAGETTSTSGVGDFMVACYLPGPEIGTFTASASTVTSGGSLTLTASNLSDGDPAGAGYATITQVAFYAVDQSGNQFLLGYGTLSNGVWTLNDTVTLASGSYTLFGQATDSDGIIGDSALLTLTVQ
jgi:uncharacterized delta-60 repeat protein